MVEGDGRRIEKDENLVGVGLDKAKEGANTGGEGTVSDDVARKELLDGCFESRHSLFAEGCGHGVSEGGGM